MKCPSFRGKDLVMLILSDRLYDPSEAQGPAGSPALPAAPSCRRAKCTVWAASFRWSGVALGFESSSGDADV